jgi:16S rRNA (cytidine1402-2'-O)-methyltransferase
VHGRQGAAHFVRPVFGLVRIPDEPAAERAKVSVCYGSSVERGALYLVATPIGNLSDITLRALEILKSVHVIACEDTRVTRKLLDHHQIGTPTLSFHAHSAPELSDRLCDRLVGGESCALVSDAGTPVLSDPGLELVDRAIHRGIAVVPIPGASALLAAITASGLPAHRILFLGFLPRSDIERREVLAPLREAPYTIVIYESPHRVGETLAALSRSLGDRRAVVARELTKHFETFVRDRLSALASTFGEAPPKGEVVIVVGPAESTEQPSLDLQAEARALLAAGTPPSEAAKTLAGRFGLAKKEAYRMVLEAQAEPQQLSLEDLLLEKLRAYAESFRFKDHAPENMYGLIMPQLERPLIRVAMEIAQGRQIQAAEMLGIHRNTLRTKLRSLGLDGKTEDEEEEDL